VISDFASDVVERIPAIARSVDSPPQNAPSITVAGGDDVGGVAATRFSVGVQVSEGEVGRTRGRRMEGEVLHLGGEVIVDRVGTRSVVVRRESLRRRARSGLRKQHRPGAARPARREEAFFLGIRLGL